MLPVWRPGWEVVIPVSVSELFGIGSLRIDQIDQKYMPMGIPAPAHGIPAVFNSTYDFDLGYVGIAGGVCQTVWVDIRDKCEF